MRLIFLLIGTVLGVLLIVKIMAGKKYIPMVEHLDDGEYPLKDMYIVGLSWCEVSVFALKGKLREKFIGQAKLLYDPRYAEYYATILWSGMITFIHFSLTMGFLLAGFMNSALMLVIGIACAGLFGFYFANRMNDLLNDRRIECTAELPEIVSTMALLVNAGMMLREAWRRIADSKEGVTYKLMRESCYKMDNGYSEGDAIADFGRMCNSPEVRKFTSALTQSMERGGGELSTFLLQYSSEMWSLKKQTMLQKGEKAASALLGPTAIIFVGIILVVIGGALGMLI
jgi:tight adherence protein C